MELISLISLQADWLPLVPQQIQECPLFINRGQGALPCYIVNSPSRGHFVEASWGAWQDSKLDNIWTFDLNLCLSANCASISKQSQSVLELVSVSLSAPQYFLFLTFQLLGFPSYFTDSSQTKTHNSPAAISLNSNISLLCNYFWWLISITLMTWLFKAYETQFSRNVFFLSNLQPSWNQNWIFFNCCES